MSETIRQVVGESLSSSVGGRSAGRFAAASNGDLFARLGVSDPWGRALGSGRDARRQSARALREQRLAERLARFDAFGGRLSQRFWPGERRRRSPWGGMGYTGEFVFPLLPLDEVDEAEDEASHAPRRRRRSTGSTMRPVENPWHSGTHVPARVAAPTASHGGAAARSFRSASRRPVARAERAVGRLSPMRPASVAALLRPAEASAALGVSADSGRGAASTRLAASASSARVARSSHRPSAGSSQVPAPSRRTAAAPSLPSASNRALRSAAAVDRGAGSVRGQELPQVSAPRRVRQLDGVGARLGAVVRAKDPARQAVAASTRRSAPPSLAAVERLSRALRESALTTRSGVSPVAAAAARAGQPVARGSEAGAVAPGRSLLGASRAARRDRTASVRAALGPVARLVQPTLEQSLGDSGVSPVAVAASRIEPKGKSRGLRPVFRSSPVLSAVFAAPASEGPAEEAGDMSGTVPRRSTAVRQTRGATTTAPARSIASGRASSSTSRREPRAVTAALAASPTRAVALALRAERARVGRTASLRAPAVAATRAAPAAGAGTSLVSSTRSDSLSVRSDASAAPAERPVSGSARTPVSAAPTASPAGPVVAGSRAVRRPEAALRAAFARVQPQRVPGSPSELSATARAVERSHAGAMRPASLLARPVPTVPSARSAGVEPAALMGALALGGVEARGRARLSRSSARHPASLVARADVGVRRLGSVMPRPMPRVPQHGRVRELYIGRPEPVLAQLSSADASTDGTPSSAAAGGVSGRAGAGSSRSAAARTAARAERSAENRSQRARVPGAAVVRHNAAAPVLDFGLGGGASVATPTAPASDVPVRAGRSREAAVGRSVPTREAATVRAQARGPQRAASQGAARVRAARPVEGVAARLESAQAPAASRSLVPRPGASLRTPVPALSLAQRAASQRFGADPMVGLAASSSEGTRSVAAATQALAPAVVGLVERLAAVEDGARRAELARPARLRTAVQHVAARQELFVALPAPLQARVVDEITGRVLARAEREQLTPRVTPPPTTRRPDPWGSLASPVDAATLLARTVESAADEPESTSPPAVRRRSSSSPRVVSGPPASVVERARQRDAERAARQLGRTVSSDAGSRPAAAAGVSAGGVSAGGASAGGVASSGPTALRQEPRLGGALRRSQEPLRAAARVRSRTSSLARSGRLLTADAVVPALPVGVTESSEVAATAPRTRAASHASARSARPVTVSRAASSVARPASREVRAAVQGLVARRSRPSALGYARLTGRSAVATSTTARGLPVQLQTRSAGPVRSGSPQAGTFQAGTRQAGTSQAGSPRAVTLRSANRSVGGSHSRPLDWAGVRTGRELAAPVHAVRDAVRSVSTFRAMSGGVRLADWQMTFAEPSEHAGVAAGAAPGASEAGEWVVRTGRHVVRTADGRFLSPRAAQAAGVLPELPVPSAAAGELPSAAARGQAASVSRAARQAPEGQLAAPGSQPDGAASLEQVGASTSRSAVTRSAAYRTSRGGSFGRRGGAAGPGTRAAAAYRMRPSLGHTMGRLQDDEASADHPSLPVWARRTSGEPLDFSRAARAGGDLFTSLARASKPAEVVQAILAQGHELQTVSSSLPAPVVEVIETIRTEARKELQSRLDAARRGEPRASRQAATAPEAKPLKGMASRSPEVKLVKAVKAAGRKPGSRRSAGVGADRVMKLAQRLESLVHLAEGARDQDSARRQVRMAEDSAAARAEGQGASGEAGVNEKHKQLDVEALSREVLMNVERELSMRRERRPEDPDGYTGF